MAHSIYPYKPPHEFAENVWQIEGSLAFPVPRNMTVFRTAKGELILYSVIAMHEDAMRALEALGTPTVMVIAHDRHHMDASFYKARYPDLRVVAPPGAKPIKDLPVDAALDALSAYGVRAYVLPGNTKHDVVMELPVPGGVVVCACETLGLMPEARGLLALFIRIIGPPGGGFGVAKAVKWREINDRPALRQWLRATASQTQTRMVLTGHGAPLLQDVRRSLEHAADRV